MKKLAPICCALLLCAACGKKKSSSEEAPPPAKSDTEGVAKTAPAPAKPPAGAPPAASALTERLLAAGDHAPDFSMVAHDGTTVSPSSIDGPLVLYFYPKDETPG